MSQNLSDAFGASARGLVRPGQRPHRNAQPTAAEPAEETRSGPSAATQAPPEPPLSTPAAEEPSVRAEPDPRPAHEEEQGNQARDEQGPAPATSQSIVYLAPALRDALDSARKRDRRTNADLVFDAIDRAQYQLPELIRRQQRLDRPPNSLFSARPSRTRQRATTPAERTVPFSFRATADELSVIDRLVEETNASSRSSLVAAAVEATFGRGARRKR